MESEKDQGRASLLYVPLGGVALVICLYFGLFGVILLDELVFRTFLLSRHSPDGLRDFIRLIYRPLTGLFG